MELLKLYDTNFLNTLNKMKASTEEQRKKKEEVVDAHVAKILPTLNKKKLKTVDLNGHELDFFTYWNKFVKGQKLKTYEQESFVSSWSRNVLFASIHYKYMKDDLIDAISSDFRAGSGYNCQKTGIFIRTSLNEKLEFEFSVFTKVDVERDGKIYKVDGYVPLAKAKFQNKIYEKVVEFKSGKLLIADWFRNSKNEFSSAVKEEKPDYSSENSINYPQGRVRAITRKAELGFVSVNVGNSCPSVFQVGNNIYVGDYKATRENGDAQREESRDKNYKGSVCTDLWNATIIDEVTYLELLIKSGKTKKEAQALLKEVKKDSMKVQVKPGKYKISFCGEHEEFNKKFRAKHKTKKIKKNYELYFTVEKV